MNNHTLKLTDHDLLELADARGSTLHVARGTLWVTQHGDRSDIVLTTGDTWTIEHYGLTVVEARGDADVTIIGRRGRIARNTRRRRAHWRERLARWIEQAADQHLRRPWVPHV